MTLSFEPAGASTAPSEKPKAAILRVATALFAEHGFALVSVRGIAKAAGVDPTLVLRHFGSKEALFLEAASFEGSLGQVFDGPLDTLGTRLIERILLFDERALNVYAALTRASDSSRVQLHLRRTTEKMFVEPLVDVLAGPHAELRARLISAQVSGLMNALRVQGDTALLDSGRPTLIELYGAAIQALVDTRPGDVAAE